MVTEGQMHTVGTYPDLSPRGGVWGRNKLSNRLDSWAREFCSLKGERHTSKTACKLLLRWG